ncbi:MAG: AhpC/TSA family protein [Candidatus Symbiothrix sp.]|jgi:peroxiredoxin|nr:AhpC/TSA family protein [Candidatus Symbiothrix sp.]
MRKSSIPRALYIVLFSLCFLSLSAQKKGVFTIEGKIGDYSAPAVIYLQYLADENGDENVASKSVVLKNGRFSFTGTIDEPANGRLVLLPNGGSVDSNPSGDQLLLLVTPEKMQINSADHLANARISGSKINAEHQSLMAGIDAIQKQQQALMEEYQNASPELLDNEYYLSGLENRYQNLEKEQVDVLITFINEHPDSYLSVMTLSQLTSQTNHLQELNTLFKKLKPDIQNSKLGKTLSQHLHTALLATVGSVAPDFTQNDVDGKPIRLSGFRGKYLLLDFWASWCGPCRMENPNLVRMYQAYKGKDFEILGVSLDQGDRSAWIGAIKKDQLTWPQVSDLKGWRNAVARQYNITSIPQNYLINPDGVIIAKNLRGEQLVEKLAEILK